ncbi:MAG: hypothetical protein V2A65_00855 [Candidatus Omnitrophota bacterium]
MNSPNEEQKQKDNMESLKQQASVCRPECGCHATGASGRIRWVLGAIVLVAAAAMVARALIKSNRASTQPSAPAFEAPAGVQMPAPESDSAAPSVKIGRTSEVMPGKKTGSATPSVQVQKPSDSKDRKGNASAAPPVTNTKESEAVVGKKIGAISELNTVAVDVDAVFVFLPGKNTAGSSLPTVQINGAMRTIEAQGQKIGLFTLKTDSRDYENIAAQVSVPAVLAMVKGRGMSAVSGDITETKLVQGFVAASRAGGCGSGCGPSGCN